MKACYINGKIRFYGVQIVKPSIVPTDVFSYVQLMTWEKVSPVVYNVANSIYGNLQRLCD